MLPAVGECSRLEVWVLRDTNQLGGPALGLLSQREVESALDGSRTPQFLRGETVLPEIRFLCRNSCTGADPERDSGCSCVGEIQGDGFPQIGWVTGQQHIPFDLQKQLGQTLAVGWFVTLAVQLHTRYATSVRTIVFRGAVQISVGIDRYTRIGFAPLVQGRLGKQPDPAHCAEDAK